MIHRCRTSIAGGIRSTLAATRRASDADLNAGVARLRAEYLAQGTTTVEIDGRHVGVGQFASSRILVTSRS